jgi:hypothetical protein
MDALKEILDEHEGKATMAKTMNAGGTLIGIRQML